MTGLLFSLSVAYILDLISSAYLTLPSYLTRAECSLEFVAEHPSQANEYVTAGSISYLCLFCSVVATRVALASNGLPRKILQSGLLCNLSAVILSPSTLPDPLSETRPWDQVVLAR